MLNLQDDTGKDPCRPPKERRGGGAPGEEHKRFQCTFEACGRWFKDKKVLRKHMLTHQPRRFHCEYPGCNKSFYEKAKLKRHNLVHSGEKNFVCTYENCGKRFALKANLQIHYRVHTGNKPYECFFPGCNKRFSQTSGRNSHYRTHMKQQQKRAISKNNDTADDDNIDEKRINKKKRTISTTTTSSSEDSSGCINDENDGSTGNNSEPPSSPMAEKEKQVWIKPEDPVPSPIPPPINTDLERLAKVPRVGSLNEMTSPFSATAASIAASATQQPLNASLGTQGGANSHFFSQMPRSVFSPISSSPISGSLLPTSPLFGWLNSNSNNNLAISSTSPLAQQQRTTIDASSTFSSSSSSSSSSHQPQAFYQLPQIHHPVPLPTMIQSSSTSSGSPPTSMLDITEDPNLINAFVTADEILNAKKSQL